MTTIADQLRAIVNQLEGQEPGSGVGLIYPGPNGLAIVDGVVLAIDEPIRADWKVSMEARALLAQGRIGYEPSNAYNSGLPKRSPSGYPLMYGVGAYGPQPPGRVLYDGAAFESEAAVEDYKARVAARPPAGSGHDFSPHPG